MPGQVFTDMDSGQNQPWAISDTTVNEDDIEPQTGAGGYSSNRHRTIRADFQEAVSDYNQRKKERLVLTRRFQPGPPLRAAAAGGCRAVPGIAHRPWTPLRTMQSAYGGYLGITYFSEVYFNIAQTAALVYILDWCGNLCSQAEWVYLEKQNGVWVRRSGKAPAQT